MEVQHTKHPEELPPTVVSLDTYPDCPPDLVSVDITDNMVTDVAV